MQKTETLKSLYDNPNLRIGDFEKITGQVKWQAPSNIALVKYWGKRSIQLPRNPSISFTLSEAHTITTVKYTNRGSDRSWVDFWFENNREPQFADRIERFFKSLLPIYPFLVQLRFEISSFNSFPHSSGIASSASSMAALALCLCDIERVIFDVKHSKNDFTQKASFIARLGSGSAARSVIPQLGMWGKNNINKNSSNYYSNPVVASSPFDTFHDDILIVSAGTKAVSSSAGHRLMNSNPYATTRYQQANDNLKNLVESMKDQNIQEFGNIVENEALTLHALMMCSDPSYILMEPNTLTTINKIRTYRKDKKVPIFFTLDAGPNVHILYPDYAKEEAQSFIENDLTKFAQDGRIIKDQVGSGPIKLQ